MVNSMIVIKYDILLLNFKSNVIKVHYDIFGERYEPDYTKTSSVHTRSQAFSVQRKLRRSWEIQKNGHKADTF